MRSRQTKTIEGIIVSEADIWPLLSTAFEGGSNYWITGVNVSKKTTELRQLFASTFEHTVSGWRWLHQVPFVLAGESTWKGHELELQSTKGSVYLTIHTLFEGLEKMYENSKRHYWDFINENWDAITADVFLQYAVFGEVIYG